MSSPAHPPARDPRHDARLAALTGAVREAAAHRADDAAPSRPAPLTRAGGQIDRTAVAFSVFENLLATDGLRAALYSLLRLTDYRFISIFRFKDGMATSAVHVDRDDLTALQAGEVPDTATYCCFVRDSGGAFVTADALVDPRTTQHVAREAVRAYCGVPILEADGSLIGTLCHYDVAPRDPEQLDLELLLQASSAIAQSGTVPPYPSRAAAG